MTAHHVRIATPDDAPGVTACLSASYGELLRATYAPDLLARALPLMTTANPALLASGSFFVVDDDGIVGCGGWSFERPGTGEVEPGLAHLRHFAVHPRHVRRGVGRALLDHTLATATAAGALRFECYATLGSEPFYTQLGFTPVRSMLVPMGPDVQVPGVLMCRGSRS